MVKGKKGKDSSMQPENSNQSSPTINPMVIFKTGMNFENTIEFIESKVLDAFFGHICRQSDWDLAKQYIQNVEEWVQMLQTTAKLELHFLPEEIQNKIISISENLEKGIKNLLKFISQRDFDESNRGLENILREIRNLYKLRE